jgi:nucleoid-associated protein YgaU
MQAAPSIGVQFPRIPVALTRERTRAREALARRRSSPPTRLLLAIGTAFPLLIGAVTVPRLASTGHASERFAVVRPASGAPARVAPLPVAPPPTLEPPARVSATPPPAAARPVAGSDASPATPHTYTVQPGDELRDIAAQHGVSIASILALNEVPNPDNLRVGQTLRFPNP